MMKTHADQVEAARIFREEEKNRRAFQVADKKFREGESINNAELAVLIARYRFAAEGLRSIYHPEYKLVENDINSRLRTLEGFDRARKESPRYSQAERDSV